MELKKFDVKLFIRDHFYMETRKAQNGNDLIETMKLKRYRYSLKDRK